MLDVNAISIEVDPIVPSGHLGVESSLFFATVGLLAFWALVGHALLAASRHRRMAASASASFQPDKPYVPGDIVLHGSVEMAEGATRAVLVEVEQEGTESESSGVWSHAWTEVSRQVFVEPFYLVDAAGRRTRVEPNDDVLLVDAMDGKILVNVTRRIRTAELTPGEEVWASGQLTASPDPEGEISGYRGGPAALVLKAPAGRPMLLSSEPLGARFEAKAQLYARWSSLLGFVAVMAWSMAFGPYLVRLIAGETRSATITQLHTYDTENDGDVTHHYGVRFSLPGVSASLADDVPIATFNRLEEGQSIPVRWVRAMPQLTSLGPDATVGSFPMVLAFFFVWIGAAVYYRSRIQRSLSWYEKKVIDKGKGKLAGSA